MISQTFQNGNRIKKVNDFSANDIDNSDRKICMQSPLPISDKLIIKKKAKLPPPYKSNLMKSRPPPHPGISKHFNNNHLD
jgi:hypothetical protein